MQLSVIVTEMSPGIAAMLERELNGIDAEIIEKKWSLGLKKARGDFVCLLEGDSALKPGTIRDNLEVFTSNPSYRKLAMVSPLVDFDDAEQLVSFTYENGRLRPTNPTSSGIHAVRVGYAAGAIIRRSSLIKSGIRLDRRPSQLSTQLSIGFWQHGLRISLNPDSTYYAPIDQCLFGAPSVKWSATPPVMALWQRELIA